MVKTMAPQMRAKIASLPTVWYPDEVVEHWNKIAEIARVQLATGEIYPQTAEEVAAEFVVVLD